MVNKQVGKAYYRVRLAVSILDSRDSGQVYPPLAAPKATRAGLSRFIGE